MFGEICSFRKTIFAIWRWKSRGWSDLTERNCRYKTFSNITLTFPKLSWNTIRFLIGLKFENLTWPSLTKSIGTFINCTHSNISSNPPKTRLVTKLGGTLLLSHSYFLDTDEKMLALKQPLDFWSLTNFNYFSESSLLKSETKRTAISAGCQNF